MSWPFFTSARYVAQEGRVRHGGPPKKCHRKPTHLCIVIAMLQKTCQMCNFTWTSCRSNNLQATFVHSLCMFQPRSAHVPPISGVAHQQPQYGLAYTLAKHGLAKHAIFWVCCKHTNYKGFDVCATTPPPIPSREPRI